MSPLYWIRNELRQRGARSTGRRRDILIAAGIAASDAQRLAAWCSGPTVSPPSVDAIAQVATHYRHPAPRAYATAAHALAASQWRAHKAARAEAQAKREAKAGPPPMDARLAAAMRDGDVVSSSCVARRAGITAARARALLHDAAKAGHIVWDGKDGHSDLYRRVAS